MNNTIFSTIVDGPLWIFTADRQMNAVEISTLKSNLDHFISMWDAHGKPVHATYEILDDSVVIIAADGQKSDVTGCSKDKLSHFFMDLGKVFSIDFFNRMLIAVLGSEKVQLIHWNDIEVAVDQGKIRSDQKYIDATLSTVAQFKSKGFCPIADLLVAQG